VLAKASPKDLKSAETMVAFLNRQRALGERKIGSWGETKH
jgi:hypothetical protein